MRAAKLRYTEKGIDERIDRIYPPCKIGHISFKASRILKRLDMGYYRYFASKLPDYYICTNCYTVHDTKKDAQSCCN